MQYIIKVKKIYVEQIGLWTKFTAFKYDAQRFDSKESAEEAVEDLFDPSFYRTFERHDVDVIPYEE